ncbi:MAG: ABC transporter substrate-binding protein [Myxococcales bacterium]|nr:ABC transporter substrate-binding protein [Myxococcales bacterium]
MIHRMTFERGRSFLAVLILVAAGQAWADAGTPGVDAESADVDAEIVRTVERLHATMLSVMKDSEALGYAGRYKRLEPVVRSQFDLPFMAAKSVGRYWKTASQEERDQLVKTFSRFSVANYAGRFDGWSGQTFETLGVDASARGTMLVRTKLLNPSGDDIQLYYRLRNGTDGRWKIIDVYLNGTVSELALRRSEYSSLIKREGFEALLIALNKRIETLADQAS